MRRISAALVLAALLAGGCGPTGGETVALTEIQRVRSGNIEILLLSRDATLHPGKDVFTLEFRMSPSGRFVDVGVVKGSASMPMPGTSPMFGEVSVQVTSVPGRYIGHSNLSMAGGWHFTLEWDGPAGGGMASLSPTVQ